MGEHEFGESLKRGKEGEHALDEFFERQFRATTTDVPRWAESVVGYDRIVTFPSDVSVTIQYKADYAAATTGNVAIEKTSSDTDGSLGWVYTCCANYLTHLIPPGRVLIAEMVRVKKNIKNFERYDLKPAKNKGGYSTWCWMVPIEEYKKFVGAKEWRLYDRDPQP